MRKIKNSELTPQERKAVEEAIREDKWLTTEEMWRLMGWQKR